jgi:hypothetical protein
VKFLKNKNIIFALIGCMLMGGAVLLGQYALEGAATGAFGRLDLQNTGTCTAGPSNTIRLCGSGAALYGSYNGGTIFPVLPLDGSAPQQQASVTLTNAQILAMYTTPVTIIAAQGAGSFIKVVDMTLENVDGGTAYTSGGAIQLSYGTALTYPATATVAATFLTSPTVSQMITAAGALATTPSSNVLNTAVDISNATGVFATGTGTLVVRVSYRVITGF